ncbi:MAG: hypothetical protein MJZ41_06515 [Bacteroidaceae bacterium]|nr:hypothetical protein [Bacteroidaceae bacterium]
MPQRVYYKVTDTECGLYKKTSEFLAMEEELRKTQHEAVKARVPKFTTFLGERDFNRIIRYKGFVFDNVDDIDTKVWTTKLVDGKMCSTPNKRTKAGKAMDQFLREFKRTTCWDVDRLLNIEKLSINGSFYPADLFKHNDTIYLLIDTQRRKMFEENNPDAVEIAYGEMEKAINDYTAE